MGLSSFFNFRTRMFTQPFKQFTSKTVYTFLVRFASAPRRFCSLVFFNKFLSLRTPAITSRLAPKSLLPQALLAYEFTNLKTYRCAHRYFFAALGRFAPYFERRCVRFATPAVSSVPRTM